MGNPEIRTRFALSTLSLKDGELSSMNIQVQCCGLAILTILLDFSMRKKNLGLFSEKLFRVMLAATYLCISLDIISVVLIVNHEKLPELLVLFVCKLYIASLVWVGFLGFIYAIMDLHGFKDYFRAIIKDCVFVVLGTVLIFVFPIYYYVDGRYVYSYGASTIVAYIFAFGFVFATLYQSIVNKEYLKPNRRRAIILWMLVWITAAVIQFFNNTILLVGFASALGMVILFFELENPEAKIDRETGAYNSHALLEYLNQFYGRQKKFSVLVVSMERYQRDVEEVEDFDLAMTEIVQYLETFQGSKVFKNVEHELYMVFEESADMYPAFNKIQERFGRSWNRGRINGNPVVLNPLYIVLPDSSVATSGNDLFSLLKYFRYEADQKEHISTICYVDANLVKAKKEREDMKYIILKALEENRVEVFLQPIYDTKAKVFVSAEALVRIKNEDGSYIPPGKFIEVAEETGLIGRLGDVVFEKTCRFIKRYQLWEYGVHYIEVNLSIRQCENRNLAEQFLEIMNKYDLDPSYINLEITETASIQARKSLLDNMNVLIENGVNFSLDDFGSGESNLNYIVDMPVSIVKFDRDMSQAYFENKRAKFVMEATMKMVHDMKLKIVCEGIETEEQVNTIVAMGIDYIQGFYFSRPLPMNEYLDFIKKHNRTSSI